jgi:hypothetical protein
VRPALPPLDGCVDVSHGRSPRYTIDGFPTTKAEVDVVLETDPASDNLARSSEHYRLASTLALSLGTLLLLAGLTSYVFERHTLAEGFGVGGAGLDLAGVPLLWRWSVNESQAIAAHNIGRCR